MIKMIGIYNLERQDSKMWEIGDIDKVTGKTAFDYKDTDIYAKEVVDNYIEKLACGIANFANIFRPNAVVLGGGVCAQGDNLIKPLQKIVDREIFAERVTEEIKKQSKAGMLKGTPILAPAF